MSEQIDDTGERLEYILLEELHTSDTVVITTGLAEQAWAYTFIVDEPGTWPKGVISAFGPNGELLESTTFVLHGAGQWTTRQQNPVQDQERGFSSYWRSIYTGGIMAGVFGGQTERAIFDKPGQEISSIVIHRSR